MGLLDNILGTNNEPAQPTDSNDTQGAVSQVVNVWSEPTEHPNESVIVLCELYPHLPLSERVYVKGQYDDHNGVFFTSANGPYQILDVARWMEVK